MTFTSEKKGRIFDICYLSAVFLLCTLSVVLCFLGMFDVIDLEEQPYFTIDLLITVTFWIEYLVRFFAAKKKGEYFKETFIELISILPYSPEFSALHFIRLLRFVRFLKLPSLPRAFQRKLRRARILLREFFNSKGLAYVLMAGVLILVTDVFVLDRALVLPYFQALKLTAVSCFSLSSATIQAQTAAYIVFIVLLLCIVWLILASVNFSQRFLRMKRAVGKKAAA